MHIICRKLIATYFSATLIGLGFGFLIAIQEDAERATLFYGLSLLALFYGGIVILIYGGVTSILSELVNKRWLHDWTLTFVIFHMLFGILFGIFFNEFTMVLVGSIGALFYALTDRVLYKQKEESKLAFLFLFFPPVIFFLGILFFWVS